MSAFKVGDIVKSTYYFGRVTEVDGDMISRIIIDLKTGKDSLDRATSNKILLTLSNEEELKAAIHAVKYAKGIVDKLNAHIKEAEKIKKEIEKKFLLKEEEQRIEKFKEQYVGTAYSVPERTGPGRKSRRTRKH